MDYPGEKLVLRLWETLAEKGLGSLFAPWQARRMGRAEINLRREELLAMTQAEIDAEGIRSGVLTYQDGEVIRNSDLQERNQISLSENPQLIADFHRLEKTIQNNLIKEEIRKEANLSHAISVAEGLLEKDKQEPPESRVDDDWLYSWRDYAGRVSSEELQDLWGRILAGEVKSPGSYSIRTLQFLRGISRIEAELISKVAKFVFRDFIVKERQEFLEREGVTLKELLFLQDIGILSSVDSIGVNKLLPSKSKEKYLQYIFAGNKVIILEGTDPKHTIQLPVYIVTSIGKEILRLASFSVDAGYLEAVAKSLSSGTINVRIADWIQTTADSGRYENAKNICA